MSRTKIEWADYTWGPVTGCTKVSEGCRNCYAEQNAKRFWGNRPFTEVRCHEHKLEEPLHWRKPRRVFVNSMSDLFHPDVPFDFIDRVFAVIVSCTVFKNRPDHVFQILTKRPERMADYFSTSPSELIQRWAKAGDGWIFTDNPDVLFSEAVYSQVCHMWDKDGRNSSGSAYKPWGYPEQLFPLSNVWLGVTAENQQTADERIPLLLQTPAAVRFVSVEPMLGEVDLSEWLSPWHIETLIGMDHDPRCDGSCRYCPIPVPVEEFVPDPPMLDWVICGGESGPCARPMHPDWARSLRDQCQDAGVPFFFKQWGEWYPDRKGIYEQSDSVLFGNTVVHRIGKNGAGRLLDGVEHNEFPEVQNG